MPYPNVYKSLTPRVVFFSALVGLLGMLALPLQQASFAQNLPAPAGFGVGMIKVPNGTSVVLRLQNEVTSKSAAVGTKINFNVVGDVRVGLVTVIKDGTMGHAQVSSVERSGFIGDEGSITITDFATTGVDGTRIPLSATLSDRGKSKQTLSLVLGLTICTPFLLMKGKDAVIPAGTERTVYTSSDVYIKGY